jgi:hypothetical protein
LTGRETLLPQTLSERRDACLIGSKKVQRARSKKAASRKAARELSKRKVRVARKAARASRKVEAARRKCRAARRVSQEEGAPGFRCPLLSRETEIER